ncbi:MAG: hypothetical protein JXR73_14275, partial [Candidatus Omnitrophica bacterium]|nr:hypothetical protein [Candidatus Omnitrophota bacterium]
TLSSWEVGFLLDKIYLEKSNAEIALISGSKEPEGADPDIVYRLKEMGMNVAVTGDEDIDNADPPRRSSYTKEVLESDQIKLLIISATVDSANVLDEYLDVDVPILTLEQAIVDDMQIGAAGGGFSELREWAVLDNTHPITDELSVGNIVVQESPKDGLPGQLVYILDPLTDGASKLIASPDDSTQYTLVTVDEGIPLLDGNPAPNRRAFLGLSDWNLGADVATDQTWQIFDATVEWLIAGETSIMDWSLY